MVHAMYFQGTGSDSYFDLQNNGAFVQGFTSSNSSTGSTAISNINVTSGDKIGLNFTNVGSSSGDFTFTLFIEYSGSVT